jgi:predicted glycosyltransferase
VRDLRTANAGVLRQQLGLPRNGPLIFATVGSGYDGYAVLESAQAAVEQLRAKFPDLLAIMVTGPFMPPEQQAKLQARATDTCRVLLEADNFQLMAAADVIVSMGGYNSVCEALAVARPLVIVPRATHKIEQQIRAEAMAARGLARWVHPRELNGNGLVEALDWALLCDWQSQARLVHEVIPSFDGAARLTAYLSRWLGASSDRNSDPAALRNQDDVLK